MGKKKTFIISATVFIMIIAGASLAYVKLRTSVSPEILLADQQAVVSTPNSQENPDEENENAASNPEKMKAPDFTVEDSHGNSIKLSDMEGKPVVLNFWASWCPPCKAEMPEFNTVFAELGNEVNFMMINLTDGQRETKKSGENYIVGQGFSFPVYFDTTQEAAYAYGISSIPTTIFIDSEGYLIAGAEGQLDEETLRYGISLVQESE